MIGNAVPFVLFNKSGALALKKASLLVVVFLVAFVSTVFAENSPDRYKWIYSNDYVGYFFDSKTLQIENIADKNMLVTAWIKEVLNQSGIDNYVLNPLHIKNVSYLLCRLQFD
jgi:hypothetical protein